MEKLPAIALGTWSWSTDAAGGAQVFGNNLIAEDSLTQWLNLIN